MVWSCGFLILKQEHEGWKGTSQIKDPLECGYGNQEWAIGEADSTLTLSSTLIPADKFVKLNVFLIAKQESRLGIKEWGGGNSWEPAG